MTNIDPAIAEIWSKKLLKRINANAVMRPLVNTDYEGEIKKGGDVVHARLPGDVAINNYTREAAITYEHLAWTVQDLTINQQKYFAFSIDDLDKAQLDVDIMDPELEQAAVKIRNVIDTRLLSHYANTDASNILGASTAPIVLTKDNVFQYFAKMMTLIDNQNPLGLKRRAVVPPFIKEMIITSPELSARGSNLVDDTVQNGLVVKNFAGWEVHCTTNMAQVSDAYPLMFFTEMFISFADQVSKVEVIDQMQASFESSGRGLFLYGSTVFTQYDGEGGVLYAAPVA